MSGRDVRRIRKRLRLSRARLAHELNVATVTVTRWENETRPVSMPYPRMLLGLESGIVLPRLPEKAA